MVELVARSIAVSETMIWQEMKMARVGEWEANKNNNTSFGKVRKGGSEARVVHPLWVTVSLKPTIKI